jgi:hypothetical protein
MAAPMAAARRGLRNATDVLNSNRTIRSGLGPLDVTKAMRSAMGLDTRRDPIAEARSAYRAAALDRTTPPWQKSIDTFGSSPLATTLEKLGRSFGVGDSLSAMQTAGMPAAYRAAALDDYVPGMLKTIGAIGLSTRDETGLLANSTGVVSDEGSGLEVPDADESAALLDWLAERKPTYAQAACVCHILAGLHAIAMLVESEARLVPGVGVIRAELISGVLLTMLGFALHVLEHRR